MSFETDWIATVATLVMAIMAVVTVQGTYTFPCFRRQNPEAIDNLREEVTQLREDTTAKFRQTNDALADLTRRLGLS